LSFRRFILPPSSVSKCVRWVNFCMFKTFFGGGGGQWTRKFVQSFQSHATQENRSLLPAAFLLGFVSDPDNEGHRIPRSVALASTEPMTIIFFFKTFSRVLKWGFLFDERSLTLFLLGSDLEREPPITDWPSPPRAHKLY
jgi:hypothetical protein